MDKDLHRRLQRLGVVKGFRNLAPRPTPLPLRPLPGSERATAHGPVWIIEATYPGEHRHGAYPLGDLDALPASALPLLGAPELGPRPAFLDTETTGLSGGAGTLAFLIGVGIWGPEGLTLHQLFLRDPTAEGATLRYLTALLDQATGLVTFNGQGFDLPLLETRYVLQRQPPAALARPHLDLLRVARQLWRDHLPSRRLVALETDVLEITRSEEDLPSSLIPTLYREYLQTGDPREMTRILYHNAVDILSLVTLLVHAGRLITEPERCVTGAGEWLGVGRLHAQAGDDAAARAAWEQALEADTLPHDTAARVWRELALRHKRAGEWESALALWTAWADRQPRAIEPHIERAKYFEWQAHDCAAALRETEIALERLSGLPRGLHHQRSRHELRHRQARLQRKLEIA